MHSLEKRGNGLYITHKKAFDKVGRFKQSTILSVFNFAYNMTFGKKGEHRNHRSGGSHERRLGEIFADTFQGKLSEYAIYNLLYKNYSLAEPDLSEWKLGEWDNSDLIVNSKIIAVKSTKSFGNLLLLETKDWDEEGNYIPNIQKNNSLIDFFVMVRMNPFATDLLKQNSCLYSDDVNKEKLKGIIASIDWDYDLPGYVSAQEIIQVIRDKQIIHKGDLLNGKMPMDATNYYVQAGDMNSIDSFVEALK